MTVEAKRSVGTKGLPIGQGHKLPNGIGDCADSARRRTSATDGQVEGLSYDWVTKRAGLQFTRCNLCANRRPSGDHAELTRSHQALDEVVGVHLQHDVECQFGSAGRFFKKQATPIGGCWYGQRYGGQLSQRHYTGGV